jgi:hypothetical protein
MGDRQFDKTRNFGQWVSVPTHVRGRINADDYVYINWDSSIPVDRYQVIVESASNAEPDMSSRFRRIGKLNKFVELPDVHFSQGFGSHSKILILPDQENFPCFIGDLHRGSTYYMNPNGVTSQSGHIRLERSGVV